MPRRHAARRRRRHHADGHRLHGQAGAGDRVAQPRLGGLRRVDRRGRRARARGRTRRRPRRRRFRRRCGRARLRRRSPSPARAGALHAGWRRDAGWTRTWRSVDVGTADGASHYDVRRPGRMHQVRCRTRDGGYGCAVETPRCGRHGGMRAPRFGAAFDGAGGRIDEHGRRIAVAHFALAPDLLEAVTAALQVAHDRRRETIFDFETRRLLERIGRIAAGQEARRFDGLLRAQPAVDHARDHVVDGERDPGIAGAADGELRHESRRRSRRTPAWAPCRSSSA